MSGALDRIHTAPVATPGRVGQATAVEQSRAVAEVQAAVIVAQQCPRSIAEAIRQMTEACKQPALAERAFFRYSRGGGAVTGPTVHLARELARCWGNIQYGLTELRRDDEAHQSEMQAWAWDVQTNARASTTFIVPHKRDKKGGPEVLVDLRDVYENNSNMGARRLREQIFAVLPSWLVEDAKTLCTKTLSDGGGKTVAQQVAGIVERFAALGITKAQLETKVGRVADSWTPQDLATLSVVGRALVAGETTRDEEFPAERVTAEEVRAQTRARKRPAPAPAPDEVPPPEEAPPGWGDVDTSTGELPLDGAEAAGEGR